MNRPPPRPVVVLCYVLGALSYAGDALDALLSLPERWRRWRATVAGWPEAIRREMAIAREEVERAEEHRLCAHPWCGKPAAPGDRICAEHRAAYEREVSAREASVTRSDRPQTKPQPRRSTSSTRKRCSLRAGCGSPGTSAAGSKRDDFPAAAAPGTRDACSGGLPFGRCVETEPARPLATTSCSVEAPRSFACPSNDAALRRAADPPAHDPGELDATEKRITAGKPAPLHFAAVIKGELRRLCDATFEPYATEVDVFVRAGLARCPECARRLSPEVQA